MDEQEQTDEKPVKKAYRKPVFTEYGALVSQTQGSAQHGNDVGPLGKN